MSEHQRPGQATTFDHDMTIELPVFPREMFDDGHDDAGHYTVEDTMILAAPLAVHDAYLGRSLGNAVEQVERWRQRPRESRPDTQVQDEQAEHFQGVKSQVMQVRNSLAELTPEQGQMLEPYLQRMADEYIFSSPRALRPWLNRGQTIAEWLPGAEDEYIAEFIDAHAAVLAQQGQSEVVAKEVTRLQNTLIQSIRPGVGSGIFSEDAIEAIPKLKQIEYRIGDVWDTLLKGRGGYQNHGTTYAVIPQGLGGNREEAEAHQLYLAQHAVIHESMHVVFGHFLPEIIQEAIDQHITVSIEHGGFDVIDPRDRLDLGIDDNRQYFNIRKLLSVMSSEGDVSIHPNVWTRAFTSKNRDSKDCKELDSLVWQAWGMSLEEVDNHNRAVGEQLRQDPVMRGKSAIEIQALATSLTADRLREVQRRRHEYRAAFRARKNRRHSDGSSSA